MTNSLRMGSKKMCLMRISVVGKKMEFGLILENSKLIKILFVVLLWRTINYQLI